MNHEHRIIILPSSYNRGGKTIKFKRHQVRDTKTGKILKWIK